MSIPSPQAADPLDLAQRKAAIGSRLFGSPSPTTTQLGRYAILRRVGAGGMATVYVAYDESLDRRVALKILKGERTEARARQLASEARAMARLSHPNVAAIYEFAQAVVPALGETPLHFIAIEFIDGENLRRWSDGSRSMAEKKAVLTAAGRGLAAAHAHGIVHRDFKPENVMISGAGDVKVVDFGVAGWTESIEIRESASDVHATGDSEATRPGMPGTPAYMAPEQRAGVHADALSDQFSFCVTALEVLGGQHPFEGASIETLRESPAPSIPIPDGVPRRLAGVLRRGLSRDPSQRYPNMEALLLAWTYDARRPWRWAGAAAALLAGAGGIGYGAVVSARPEPCSDSNEHLAAAWNPDRRASLGVLFANAPAPHAIAAWQQIERRLDAWATAWTRDRDAACAATRIHGTQSEAMLDRRMACFDRGRASFQALTNTLASPDADVVTHGPTASERLFPLVLCSDLSALESGAPIPEDPQSRRELAAVEAEVAVLRTELRIHSAQEMRARARALVDRAEATGVPGATARALLTAAIAENALGDETESLRRLRHALAEAEASGDANTFAETGILLGDVLSRAQDEHTQAQAMLTLAEGAVRRGHDPIDLRADLETARGLVLHRVGRDGEASDAFDRALDWLTREPDAHDEARARATTARALATAGAGDTQSAVADIEAYRAVLERQHGHQHPLVCHTHGHVATIYLRSGRWERASAELDETVSCLESTLGPEHIALDMPLSNQARALFTLGRVDDAERVAARHLALLEKHRGPESAGTADTYATLARIHQSRGQFDRARNAFDRAIAVIEARAGASPLDLADHLLARADVSLRQGDSDAARDDANRIVALLPQMGHDGMRPAASADLMLGKLARDATDFTAASRHFESAVASFEAFHTGAPNLDVVIALDYVAGLHRLRGAHAEALAATERAWSMLERLEGTVPIIEAELAFDLAQDLWRHHDQRSRAGRLALRAEERYAELGAPNVEAVRTWRRNHRVPPPASKPNRAPASG